jgi:hypothetical protein
MRREGISDSSSHIEILHPGNGLYFNNNKILPFITLVMIGDVFIQTSVSEDIEYVEFYVDEVLISTDVDYPFEWMWDEPDFFKHTIKTVAYTNEEKQVEDELIIWKFF